MLIKSSENFQHKINMEYIHENQYQVDNIVHSVTSDKKTEFDSFYIMLHGLVMMRAEIMHSLKDVNGNVILGENKGEVEKLLCRLI